MIFFFFFYFILSFGVFHKHKEVYKLVTALW